MCRCPSFSHIRKPRAKLARRLTVGMNHCIINLKIQVAFGGKSVIDKSGFREE